MGWPDLTKPAVLKAEVAKYWTEFKNRLAALPSEITFQGKKYRKAVAFQTVDGTLFYFAAMAMTDLGAIKRALGIPYDGAQEVHEVDPVTAAWITALIAGGLVLAPLILAAGFLIWPAAEQPAPTLTAETPGESGSPVAVVGTVMVTAPVGMLSESSIQNVRDDSPPTPPKKSALPVALALGAAFLLTQ